MRVLTRMGTLAETIIGIALIFTLSGCFSPGAPRGGASISVNESGELLAGVCYDFPVRALRFSSKVDWNQDWASKVLGKGQIDLKEGDYVTVRENLSGMAFERFEALDMAPGNFISVYFYESPGESGQTAWGIFEVPQEGLKPGVWLFANGATSDRVCGVYEDQRG